jgi:hypothetical protein
LVDLVLLLERGPPEAVEIRAALQATFATRGTHPLPAALGAPPQEWLADFARMAKEAGLTTEDYLEAFAKLQAFWNNHALGGSTVT